MGTFTITKWKCDCCGVELDKRPQHDGNVRYSLLIEEDYGMVGGLCVVWREMCPSCNARFDVECKRMLKRMRGENDENHP
jgi:hypothetical protein